MPASQQGMESGLPPMEELQELLIGSRRLNLFVPDPARIRKGWEESDGQEKQGFPYWSRVWPASMALCQWLEEHPSLYAGKKVAELGAGLGLPSLFVAPEAEWVLCSDKNPEAMFYAQSSAIHSRYLNMTCRQINWIEPGKPVACDLLLLSDVNYEPGGFEGLRRSMQAYLAQGTGIVLSTPQRLAAREFVLWLEPFVRSQSVIDVQAQALSIYHLSG